MNFKIDSLASDFKKYAFRLYYDLNQKLEAKKSLKTLESIKGKTNPKLIKLSNEYAIDVLGWKGYAPWLYVYSAFNETFKEGWIPENYFGRVVVPKWQGDYGKVSFLKPLSKKIFQSDLFPDIGYYVNGYFISKDYEVIPKKNIQDFLFKDSNKIVFKLANSFRGRGIFIFEKSNFDYLKIPRIGEGVFQKYIDQHPFFDKFMPDSVATIRVNTVIDDLGNVSARSADIRFGSKGIPHLKSGLNSTVSIILNTGQLKPFGIKSWKLIDRHPDTGTIFKDQIVPNFEKIIETSIVMQKKMPFVRCIGWDLIVDKDENVQILEWNGAYPGIGFNEFDEGPCFMGLGWEDLWKEK